MSSMSVRVLRRVAVFFRGSKRPLESRRPSIDELVSSEELEGRRRVRFADRARRGPLVTEVWTRPKTRRRDVSGLFYKHGEIERFRREADVEDAMAAAAASSKASLPSGVTFSKPSEF